MCQTLINITGAFKLFTGNLAHLKSLFQREKNCTMVVYYYYEHHTEHEAGKAKVKVV